LTNRRFCGNINKKRQEKFFELPASAALFILLKEKAESRFTDSLRFL